MQGLRAGGRRELGAGDGYERDEMGGGLEMDEQHEGCSVVRAEPMIFKVPPNPIHASSMIVALGFGWILSSSTTTVG